MEEVLQLCDTSGSDYPEYFKEFLNNCLEQFPNFLANDYLFAAVYFMVLECGFFPVTLYDDYPNQCSDNFDIRKLRFIKSYSANHTKFVKGQIGEFWVYTIPLRLGEYRCECELQGVPSAECNNYLIINFLTKEMGTVKSLCLDTEFYTEGEDCLSGHSVRLKNLNELSMLIKDQLLLSVKETIMLHEKQGCCPNLLRLPEDIQKKIIYSLIGNSTDIQYLASTCSYFRNIIVSDHKIWQILCTAEFDGKILNQAIHELLEKMDLENENLFWRVFIELKEKTVKRTYRYT